ncbi:single-stranded DNA-binding protein [Pseudonocardia lacus]|uniref:single-stranded DNA-binding protein n=1 Tax=Pseudonocardia lacus TaxID=2835865 RepID=UPI001BDBB3F7|nr:single-stranded DNA-binding protein [Pseudonocardia lacus]
MFETQVTVVGNVATAVKHRKLPNGDTVAKFRVASTPRWRGQAGEWSDGRPLFVSITCWRQLADNVVDSIGVGDPVVVRGRLYTDDYEYEGKRRSDIRMEAQAVGPDLSRCRAVLTRNRRSADPEGGRTVAADAGGGFGAPEPPPDDQRDRLGAPVEAGVGA